MMMKKQLVFIFLAIFATAPSMSAVFADASSPAPISSVTQSTSLNWAGYVSTGGTYTSVGGTWIVPTPTGATNVSTSADATWVGIGGVTSSDLIQSGTQAVVENGVPTYTAWIEGLPNYQQTIPLAIHGGDSVTVSLAEQTTNEWTFSFADNTTGQNYSVTVPYVSSHSSAEWIEEMPLAVGARNRASFIPLDNFGTVTFQNATVTANGVSETLSGADAQAMTMTNSNSTVLATPSGISGNGNVFSVTRSSNVSTGATGISNVIPQQGRRPGRNGNGVQGYSPRTREATHRGFFQQFRLQHTDRGVMRIWL